MPHPGRTTRNDLTPTSVTLFALVVVLAGLVWVLHVRPAGDLMNRQIARRDALQRHLHKGERIHDRLRVFDRALNDDPQLVEGELRKIGYRRSGEVKLEAK